MHLYIGAASLAVSQPGCQKQRFMVKVINRSKARFFNQDFNPTGATHGLVINWL